MLVWYILVPASLIAATISGILGMAGGITLLGIMSAVLPSAQVVPIHGVVQLGSNATRTVVFLKKVRWKIFLIYVAPLTLGVGAATLIWSGDKLTYFRPAIGVFILAFLLWQWKKPKLKILPLWSFLPLGLVAGFLTIFVGATGPFIAPFFLREDLEKEEVVATKAICQAWGHMLKIPAFLMLKFDYMPHLPLIGALLAAVIVGTLIGKAILKKVPMKWFTIFYVTVLAGIAVYLIARGVMDITAAA